MSNTMKYSFAFAMLLFCLGFTSVAAAVEIRIGYENHPGEPIDLFAKEWKRLLEEESKGEITVQIYPSSQLGSKNDIIDQMLAGDMVITLADGAFLADRGVPDYSVVFAPYLFETWDDCWKLFASDWHQEQMDKLAKLGLRILVWNCIFGERHTMTTRPVRKVADLAGMKIRVPNNTMQIVSFDALGAAPTPMPYSEAYTAIQQGVIDGLEHPLPVLYSGKFQEVAKYLTLDGHIKNTAIWLCGSAFYDTLTEAQQELIKNTGQRAAEYNNELVLKVAEDTAELFRKEGVELITVDTAEFRKASESVYSNPAVASKWTPGLVERVQAIINN